MKLTEAELRALLRRDFYSFAIRSFLELTPQTLFLPNWHLELVADRLEKCIRGEITRLIINVPPRSLKSLFASIAAPAYIHGHNPSAQIVCCSYGLELASYLALQCRTLMQGHFYHTLFPTRIAPDKQAICDFGTTRGGGRLSTSVGGVLTGRGADVIIIDDPLKPDEALSETQRTAVNDWYRHTLFSRLNDKQRGVVIIIMQRLHEDDLVGHVLEGTKEPWTVLSLPAIAERDETYTFDTPSGQRTVTRKAGEALHPERENLETLQRIRQEQGEYNFGAQYQQSPAPFGGGMVKACWFQTYTPNTLPGGFELIINSWDTANKTNELADFSACTTWGLYQKKLYLLDVYRGRLDYPALKRAVRDRNSARPGLTLIEDKSSGTPLIQELSHEGVSIQPYRSNLDKVMRMHSTSGMIENGLVFLPEKAEWRNEFLHELTIFPKGRYDDQVDSVSQCLDWIRQCQNRRKWYVSDAFTGKLIAEY